MTGRKLVYRVTATLESPAALSTRRAIGNTLTTREVLPGTAIRGALAAAYLEGGNQADDVAFQSLFVDGCLRCMDLRKEGSKAWPLSVRRCKRAPGTAGHTAVDLLLAAGAGLGEPQECASCAGKLEPERGQYVYQIREPEYEPRYHSQDVTVRRTAHVEIDPATLRAMNGRLFSTETLAHRQQFEGCLTVAAEAAEDFAAVRVEEIHLGRGRTRGQGLTHLEFDAIAVEERTEKQRKSLARLNAEAAKYPVLADKLVFSCTLLSPTILFDRWLQLKEDVEATDFAPVEGYELLAAFTKAEPVVGWHQAAGLPKTEMAAYAAGSCFLFAKAVTAAERQAKTDELSKILTEAWLAGAGERTEEGFGEVGFCERIHQRLAQPR